MSTWGKGGTKFRFPEADPAGCAALGPVRRAKAALWIGRVGIAGTVVAALFFVHAARVISSQQRQSVLEEIQSDILSQRWEEARTKLDRVASELEGVGDYHFLRAAVLIHGHDLVRAGQELERALELDPDQIRYILLRGELADRAGDWAAAERHYKRAIELDPESVGPAVLLAKLYFRALRATDAIPVLEKALRHQPDEPALHYELAVAHETLKQWDEAAARYARAVELSPGSAAAQAGLGRAYREKQETLPRAVEHLKRAVMLEPETPLWNYDLGVAFMRAGDWERARKALERAVELDPQDRRFYASLGETYRRLNLRVKAQEAHQRFLELSRAASRDAQQVARFEGDFKRAQALEFAGRRQEAVTLYQHILARSPDEPQVYFALARLYLNWGRATQAEEYIRRAVELQPGRADYRQLLATVVLERGRPAEAQRELRAALLLRPSDATSYDMLGRVALEEGQLKEAVAHFEQAVTLEPANPTFRLHLLDAYRRQGDTEAADRALREYLRLATSAPSQE